MVPKSARMLTAVVSGAAMAGEADGGVFVGRLSEADPTGGRRAGAWDRLGDLDGETDRQTNLMDRMTTASCAQNGASTIKEFGNICISRL